ncbi:tetratricopeptide repeat protein [Stieleria sp. TO1_6]|uniref:tetratricopeptide repeat protein n=1 Tax=Stieleria tagensis TaxID=2956795 RepID=UPI00209B6E40|nr:tetratricopeptide repeat protein [Stieleria tagensis]MCO8120712.1 tetratricopeptide repeat protein [Stieleria tagensis]
MSAEQPQSSGRPNRQRISLAKKICFSLVSVGAFFLVVELALAAIDYGDPPSLEDPWVGFTGSAELFIGQQDETGQPVFRTNVSKLVWFNDQSFPAVKGDNVYRIVCLGGSTTFGRPFDDSTSFCGWLRQLLPMVQPQTQWEVINAGGVSYASYRVARVMQEMSAYDVDLFVLYTGQNEFLEWRTYEDLIDSSQATQQLAAAFSRTHLGRRINRIVDRWKASTPSVQDVEANKAILPAEVDEMLNHSVGPADYRRDPEWYRGVEQHFRVNLRRMEAIAQNCGAKLAIVTPVSSLRDCAPFKALFDEQLDDATRGRLDEQLDSAQQAYSENDFAGALETLELIQQTDPQNAAVDYLLGKTLLELGRGDDAAIAFQRAIDHDVCPLRATTPIKSIVRESMRSPDVIPVDFESYLNDSVRSQLGHRCFGAESFLDHVHPTIDVHRELALQIIAALAQRQIVATTPAADQIERAIATVRGGIDRQAQGVAFRNLAKVLHWAGKFEEAQRSADDAIRLLPRDLESWYLLADCSDKLGQPDIAIERYTKLFEFGTFERALQPFGQLLARQGHTVAAKAYLMEAIFASDGLRRASAYEALGQLHLSLDENELADECFLNAQRLRATWTKKR